MTRARHEQKEKGFGTGKSQSLANPFSARERAVAASDHLLEREEERERGVLGKPAAEKPASSGRAGRMKNPMACFAWGS